MKFTTHRILVFFAQRDSSGPLNLS